MLAWFSYIALCSYLPLLYHTVVAFSPIKPFGDSHHYPTLFSFMAVFLMTRLLDWVCVFQGSSPVP